MDTADMFISYASEDRSKAEAITKALEEYGWSVWWDRTIPPGIIFDEVVEEAITASKVCRCFMVRNLNKSALGILRSSALTIQTNWGRTKVERRRLRHELKNKAVFRP